MSSRASDSRGHTRRAVLLLASLLLAGAATVQARDKILPKVQPAWRDDARKATLEPPTPAEQCACAPDPVLPDPRCILCWCGEGDATLEARKEINTTAEDCGLTGGTPTRLTYAENKRGEANEDECVCAADPYAPQGSDFLMCLCDQGGPDAAGQPVPEPKDLSSYYTAYPAPISVIETFDGIFSCTGRYALCAYAVCVPIEGSNPPVAECGCYAFDNENYGSAASTLKQSVKDEMMEQCEHNGRCFTLDANATRFCDEMHRGTMYPGYDLVSTFNKDDWINAANATANGTIPAGTYEPKACFGGTAANCFSAACRSGAPTSKLLPEGAPAYNATCYCPYFTTKKEPFAVSMKSYPCGPTDPSEVTSETLIYNGL